MHETFKDILKDRKKVWRLLGAAVALACIGIAGALDAHSEAVRDATHITQQLEPSPIPSTPEDD